MTNNITFHISWLLCCCSIIASAQTTFYVAPNGNDQNDGSENTPWATLAGARDNIQPLLSNGEDIIVYFREGTYILEETVVFDADDDGADGQTITYAAYPNETPVFSALQQVTCWTTYNGNPNIMVAPVPNGIGHVRYLQDGSEGWLQRSISNSFATTEPAGNEGCLECNWDVPDFQNAKMNIQYGTNFVAPDWTYANQYDLKASGLSWHEEILPIASVNIADRRIFTTIPSQYELRQDIAEDSPPRAYVLNSIEGIDEAGEWACLNTGNGWHIYLFPKSGTDDIYVPQLTEFIRIDGGGDGNTWTGTPVQNITFEGLTFTGGDFRVMKNDINDISNPDKNDVTTQHDWAVVDAPDALLRIRNAANIIIENCTFSKSGGTAIRLDRYAQDVLLTDNTIKYMGRNGIVLIGRGPGYGDVNKFNEITRNVIEYTGMEKWSAIAVVLSQSSNNYIHRNYIGYTRFTALTLCSPRQLAFWSHCENKGTYLGREFHYYEIAQSVIESMGGTDCQNASETAMRFVYNYDNIVENNVFVNVGVGDNYLINGKMGYFTGYRKGEINTFSYNYMYEDDAFGQDTDFAFYNDSDQDGANQFGNMMHNINTIDVLIIADAQWAENEAPPICTLLLRGNSTLNSSYEVFATHIGTPEDWYTEVGSIEVNSTGDQDGNPDYLYDYQRAYETLCPENLVVPTTEGITAYQTMLAEKITDFEGIVPACGTDNCINTAPSSPSDIFVNFTDCQIQITWNASTCANNYKIQRSENGSHWKTLSANVLTTRFVDKDLSDGVVYQYRVKAQNRGLSSDYGFSDDVESSCNATITDYICSNRVVYPNPTSTGNLTIEGIQGNHGYTIFDATGRVVQTGRVDNGQLFFNGSTGVYFIKIQDLNGVYRFVKL